jgi:hypothetical protein
MILAPGHCPNPTMILLASGGHVAFPAVAEQKDISEWLTAQSTQHVPAHQAIRIIGPLPAIGVEGDEIQQVIRGYSLDGHEHLLPEDGPSENKMPQVSYSVRS